ENTLAALSLVSQLMVAARAVVYLLFAWYDAMRWPARQISAPIAVHRQRALNEPSLIFHRLPARACHGLHGIGIRWRATHRRFVASGQNELACDLLMISELGELAALPKPLVSSTRACTSCAFSCLHPPNSEALAGATAGCVTAACCRIELAIALACCLPGGSCAQTARLSPKSRGTVPFS